MAIFKTKNKKSSIARSLPQSKTVHGITVEKLPIGHYVTALKHLEDLPEKILEICFPDQKLEQIIDKLKFADMETITEIFLNFLSGAPELVISTIAKLGNFTEKDLMNLMPLELLDVVETWWELNDLSDFCKRIWEKIAPKLEVTQIQSDGFSSGSQSQK